MIEFKEILPCVFELKNAIENYDEILNIAQSLDDNRWEQATITDHGVIDKNIRKNRSLPLNPSFNNPKEWFELSQKIWFYASKYAEYYSISFSEMETLQLLHYYPNDGFYKPHSDSGPGLERTFSAVLYLNDIEQGGETHFTNFNTSVNPEAGKLIIFPANYAYLHEAKVSKEEDKFVVVTWFKP